MAGSNRTPEAVAFGRRFVAARCAAGYPSTTDLARALAADPADLKDVERNRRWLAGMEGGENKGIDFDAFMRLRQFLPALDIAPLPGEHDRLHELRNMALDDDAWDAILNTAYFEAEQTKKRAAERLAEEEEALVKLFREASPASRAAALRGLQRGTTQAPAARTPRRESSSRQTESA